MDEIEKRKCVAGCKAYNGFETYHHKDCPYYAESFSKRFDQSQSKVSELKRALRNIIGIKKLASSVINPNYAKTLQEITIIATEALYGK